MSIGRNEGLLYDIGNGYSELDAEAKRNRMDGFAVVSGLKVEPDTGLTLQIGNPTGGGTAIVGQSSGSVDTVSLGSTGSVTLDAADSTHPRKDTIYIDTSGTIIAETGTPQAVVPDGSTRFDTYVPEPPSPSTEGVILAEVWVAAGASSIASADIRDRRQPADLVINSLAARDVVTDLVPDSDGARDLGSASTAWGAVRTESLSYAGGSRTTKREVLVTDVDTDETNSVAFDTGSMTQFDAYEVRAWIAGHGAGTTNPIKIRINGLSASNYDYHDLAAGTLSWNTGGTEWQDLFFDNEAVMVGYAIRGDSPQAQGGTFAKPTITRLYPGAPVRGALIDGRYNANVASVNRVEVFTDFNARGQISVMGVNY